MAEVAAHTNKLGITTEMVDNSPEQEEAAIAALDIRKEMLNGSDYEMVAAYTKAGEFLNAVVISPDGKRVWSTHRESEYQSTLEKAKSA